MGSCPGPLFLESELGPPPIECCSLGKKVWFAALVDCGTGHLDDDDDDAHDTTTDGSALLLLLLGESHSNAENGEKPYTSPSCRRQAGEGTAPCRLC